MEEADAKLADGALSTTDDSPADSDLSLNHKKRMRLRRRITAAFLVTVLLAAALVLPGMVNIAHYRRQITALMSRSMGRPVRMSGVELRLLPTPGFVLHDLAVSEDPQFGAEPILSARTVVASIRVLSLLRGRIEISRVSGGADDRGTARSGWYAAAYPRDIGAFPVSGSHAIASSSEERRGQEPVFD